MLSLLQIFTLPRERLLCSLWSARCGWRAVGAWGACERRGRGCGALWGTGGAAGFRSTHLSAGRVT